jgi:hypothetical protein
VECKGNIFHIQFPNVDREIFYKTPKLLFPSNRLMLLPLNIAIGNVFDRRVMHMISTKNGVSLPFANHPKLTSPACEVLGFLFL